MREARHRRPGYPRCGAFARRAMRAPARGSPVGGGSRCARASRAVNPARMASKRERRVTGENACRAVIETRPEDVLRVFLIERRVDAMRAELRTLAERR